MRSHSLLRRRPSAPMVVAAVALFVSIGGVGYAASSLPAGSVGTAQLQFHAVTGNKLDLLSVGFRKIQFGAVGIRRINTNQVQARVNGACAPNSAINTIDFHGDVNCSPTLPAEISTGTSPVAVGTGSVQVAAMPLAGGSNYLVLANPQVNVIAATGTQVQVDCTLAVPPSTTVTQSRSVTFRGADGVHQISPLSLAITVPGAVNTQTASVTCDQTPSSGHPDVSVLTGINAIQVSSVSMH